MELNRKQYAALQNTKIHRVSAFLGGIGAGKTTVGSIFAIEKIYTEPETPGIIFSNTHKQLQAATLYNFKKILAKFDIYEDQQYVVNKNPSKIFGTMTYYSSHDGIWSFSNGAQVFIFSLETMIRGIEAGWAWGDEIQEASIENLYVVQGRMRASENPTTFYTLTPPYFNPDIDDLIYGEKAIPCTVSPTFDNKHLPQAYLDEISKWDSLTYRREVLAERVTMAGLNWLYSFDRQRHVSDKAVLQEYVPVYVSIDFNTNPFVAILAHRGMNMESGRPYIHVFDTVVLTPEMVIGKTYIEAMCDSIFERTPTQEQNRILYNITGDATGRSQSVILKVGENLWTEVIKFFRVSDQQLYLRSINPTHQDSRTLCNSIFSNHPEMLIHPKCKELIRDCEFVQAKPDGSLNKDSRSNPLQQADAIDCLRYLLNAFDSDFIRLNLHS